MEFYTLAFIQLASKSRIRGNAEIEEQDADYIAVGWWYSRGMVGIEVLWVSVLPIVGRVVRGWR